MEIKRIFDSWWEAGEWADSILAECYPFDNVEYMTPDEKVLVRLSRSPTIHPRACT